jgi:signal transduction histidine kinase
LVSVALSAGAILVLVGLGEGFSYVENRRLQAEVRELFRVTERSTYLIGDIGNRLSSLRSTTLEALTEPVDQIEMSLQRAASIDATLRERLEELPSVLSPAERVGWSRLTPTIRDYRIRLLEALEAVKQGRTMEAEQQLDELEITGRTVFGDLQDLQTLNQPETQLALDAANERMLRAQLVQLVVAGVLIASIAGVGAMLLRVLRREGEQRAEHVARIEQSNRELEAFAGRVAHDLKDVLSPLHLLGHILEAAPQDARSIESAAARIQRVTRRANDVLTGLLAFARAGAPADGKRAALFEEELEAVLEELEPLKQRVGAEVTLEIEPGIVAACEPSLLHVVILNLLSNAFKFLAGQPRRRVRIRASAVGRQAVLEVSDTGPGIPPALRERIFEPFFRAEDARAPGSGIGLATVRRIVDARSGSIEVQSAVGQGTQVCVRLPRVEAASCVLPRLNLPSEGLGRGQRA